MASKTSGNVKLGSQGEAIAAEYLLTNGYRLVARNFRTRWGEIDIVASKGREYYFIEVKARQNADFGSAIESLPYYRRERLKKMALFYATQKRLQAKNLHLSLLGLDGLAGEPKITFIQDIEGD